MAFDPVPWAIGNGAEVSEETGRVFANIASRNSQGINLPGDLKVTALAVPGGAIQIAPGGVVLRNRQAPGQSYVGRAATVTQVPIAPTGSSGPRSDLVIARVRDPEFAPWQPYTDPAQIAHGPYFEPFVISGVPSNTKFAEDIVTYTAEALARIDIPANTAAITNAMIVPLRRLAQPRTYSPFDVQPGAMPVNHLATNEINWHHCPLNTFEVDVPAWATHAQVMIQLVNVPTDGPSDINTRCVIGNLTATRIDRWDYNGNPGTGVGYVETRNHFTFAEFDVRSLQGQRVVVRQDAKRDYVSGAEHPGSNNGNVWFGEWENIYFDVRFTERVV